jgi:3-oxoacyl-[acyl-carrier protein] reductase
LLYVKKKESVAIDNYSFSCVSSNLYFNFTEKDVSMSNKVYAIFGANGGIGFAVAKLLAAQGHCVYLLGRSHDKLKIVGDALGQPVKVAEATDELQVRTCLEQIIEEKKTLDGVVSCIGSFHIKPLHMTSQAEFEEVMKTNTTSSFCILKAACHLMAAHKQGSIVLCSSTAALTGLASHEAISAAKGAVASLIRSAAASYASKGVRVNGVAPGLTRTPMAHAILSSESALKASTAFHPLGRIGEPEDIAQAIIWLLQDTSSWITGEVLAVDGGLSSLKTRMA